MRDVSTVFVALIAVAMSMPVCAMAADKGQAPPKPDDMVNNPPYANWSAFPVGTSVTTREVVTLKDGSTVTQTLTSKLVEKTKTNVLVETTVADAGGGISDTSKSVTAFPAKVKLSDVQTPSSGVTSVTEGKDEITFKGKKIDAEWVEATTTNGDEVSVQKIWTARDVPGGIVKQTLTHKQGGKVQSDSVLELVELSAAS